MFDTLSDKMIDAFAHIRGKGKITEDNIESTLKEVKTALLEADVNFKVVKEFVDKVKTKALGEKVLRGVDPGEQFVKIMHDELASMMGEANEELELKRSGILPILIVGLNGQGKTTFSGKIALYLKEKKNKKVLLVPADTFRPAAKKQLQTLAGTTQVDCYDSDLSLAPRELVLRGLKYAEDNKYDVVIFDTAGRLNVSTELMNEITDVKAALNAMRPEVLLVADAMTGQAAVEVATTFHQALSLTGVVLSKMDSDARGGAALSIKYSTGVPIKFISTGEKMKDLELFHPDRLAKRILDMGDVLSLVEKAEENINQSEAEKMMKNLERQRFTIDDFMKQMDMMNKMGPMSGILKMIPGMGGLLKQVGDLSPAEAEMKKMKILISSMTQQEKEDHKLINESRIRRIARGSGTKEADVREFLKKFQQMEKMMVGMMQMMKGGGMPNMPGMPSMPGMRQMPQSRSGQSSKSGKGTGRWGKSFF
jgi:signal recognition particle subunit SRP54